MEIIILGSILFAGITIAISVGALLFFFQKYANPEPTIVQQRLMRLKEDESQLDRKLHQNRTKTYKRSSYYNERIGKYLERFRFTDRLKKLLLQAGIDIPVDRCIVLFIAMPCISSLILLILLRSPVFLIGYGVPFAFYFYVNFKRGQRFNQFTKQLPDALSLLNSSLRAGHSLQSALTVVVGELPPPLSTEFSNVVNDMNLGVPIKEALGRLNTSVDIPDVQMFSTAILIQREAGGNLAEILGKLGHTIRERFQLKGQIKSLTSQGRLTGYVLGAAPVIVFVFLFVIMNDYVKPLYTNIFGQIGLVVAGIFQVIGFIVMRKIVDIRV